MFETDGQGIRHVLFLMMYIRFSYRESINEWHDCVQHGVYDNDVFNVNVSNMIIYWVVIK